MEKLEICREYYEIYWIIKERRAKWKDELNNSTTSILTDSLLRRDLKENNK